jgi:uncharacterized protein
MMRNTWQAWLRRTAVTVLFCFSGGVVASAPAQAYDHAGLARDALEHHIRPGYKAFDAAAASFNTATIAMCAAPSADGLASVRAAFKEAALSWARAEHLSFGPIADDKRKERLLFWPDPKGITRKQVSAIIETADETAFDSRLAGKSVAVQGFTALDIVLFGDGSQAFEAAAAQGSPRCRYAQAVTANIASIAKAASDGWAEGSAYEKIWLQPGSDNSVYIADTETTQALLQSYATGVELLRDQRLKGQLGMQQVGAKALEPILVNSGLAVAFLKANCEGLRSLLDEGGFIAHQRIPPITDPKQQTLTALGTIRDELTRAIDAASAAGKLSPKPFENEAAREKLIAMGFPLKNAYETGAQTIAAQAGITLGFSVFDGD